MTKINPPEQTKREYQATIQKKNTAHVTQAIAYLKQIQGVDYSTSAIELSTLTGISRQTLSIPYYRMMWDHRYQVKDSHFVTDEEKKNTANLSATASLLALNDQIMRIKQQLLEEKRIKQQHLTSFNQLKERHERLLHHNLSILRKLRLHGIEITELSNQFVEIKTEAQQEDLVVIQRTTK